MALLIESVESTTSRTGPNEHSTAGIRVSRSTGRRMPWIRGSAIDTSANPLTMRIANDRPPTDSKVGTPKYDTVEDASAQVRPASRGYHRGMRRAVLLLFLLLARGGIAQDIPFDKAESFNTIERTVAGGSNPLTSGFDRTHRQPQAGTDRPERTVPGRQEPLPLDERDHGPAQGEKLLRNPRD